MLGEQLDPQRGPEIGGDCLTDVPQLPVSELNRSDSGGEEGPPVLGKPENQHAADPIRQCRDILGQFGPPRLIGTVVRSLVVEISSSFASGLPTWEANCA
ncbi:hypothetical protein ACFYRG_45600 [Streptomyces mirabilis]|uniref:hypothetical protein n=1 Tax=Streptomyces mirabilis TaxID=68239 RepID=UPI003674C647